MRIGALARRTGVSQWLLRYYEDQGLLAPIRRSSGYREYSTSDVVVVAHIRNLLAAGLSTNTIARAALDTIIATAPPTLTPTAAT